jgi:hypothetical protein
LFGSPFVVIIASISRQLQAESLEAAETVPEMRQCAQPRRQFRHALLSRRTANRANDGGGALRKCEPPFTIREGLADVAQLVEQSIRNRQVTGSIPVVGSIFSTT